MMEKMITEDDLHDDYTIDVLEVFEMLDQEGKKREAEAVLIDALEQVEAAFPRWVFYMNLADFYHRNHMYLKMDKISRQMIREYPDNYAGCQIHLLAKKERGHFDEAEKYMEKVGEEFSGHPRYHMDFINLLVDAGNPETALAYIDENDQVMEVVPDFALRKKIDILNHMGKTEGLDSLLIRLVFEYGDPDAANTLMILHFLKGDYRKSASLARAVLEEDADHRGHRSYLAYIFQMANLYELSGRKPDAEVRAWMRKALEWVREYVDESGVDDPDTDQLLKDIENVCREK